MENTFTVVKIKHNDSLDVIETNSTDLMETIVTNINLTPELIATCNTCWEDETHVYQIFSINHKDNGETDNLAENKLAMLLLGNETGIYGDAILFKAKINDDNLCSNASANLDDINNILKKRCNHTGILIKSTGELEEITYENLPFEKLTEDEKANYTFREINLFNLTLFIYYINDKNKEINKKVTRLIGNAKIYGDVYIVNRISEHNFGELTHSTMDKLLKITFGGLKTRELVGEELDNGIKDHRGRKIINPYRIINLRYNNFKQCCNYCGKSENLTLCSGCYRVCYDDQDCQRSDWRTHQKDCIKT
jgi:hypothetical protein